MRSCEVEDSSLFQKMVKISCLFLLVLIAFSCESKKKAKKKKPSSGHVPSWLRTPAPKPTPAGQSGPSYKVGCIIQVDYLQFTVVYCLVVLIRSENQT